MKKKSISEVCELCRYCLVHDVPQSPSVKLYTCNKLPPVEHNGKAIWPVVAKDDWCGEFKSEASLS